MSGEPLYGVGQWCDFALLGSGMVPHLPPVNTANMWLSLVLQWFSTDAATLHVGAHSAAITPTAAGCLAASFTLAYTWLPPRFSKAFPTSDKHASRCCGQTRWRNSYAFWKNAGGG
jgi:hypothetical protein